MSSVNRAIIIGRIGKDPEMRFTTAGKAVCNFSIATSENYKDKSGAKIDKTEWHNIVAFDKLAEICGEWLKKGAQVYVEGKIKYETWEDKKDGSKKYVTKIYIDTMRMLGGGKGKKEEPPTEHTDAADDDLIPF